MTGKGCEEPMIDFLHQAREIEEEIKQNRRAIHQMGGTGFDVKPTLDFIQLKLKEMNIDSQKLPCGGVTALLGKEGPVFLLRADCDALPFPEETGLPYGCTNGSCHACGHDMHSAMLLGAAKILKAHENELRGRVKLMFQPAEEIGQGALKMIEEGVLENPKVDAGMAIHIAVATDISQAGTIHYSRGPAYSATDTVTITVQGKGGHGAAPYKTIDPISIAAYIIVALEQITAREIPSDESAVVTFGSIHGGTAENAIPSTVTLKGTIRTFDATIRAFVVKRVKEIAQGIAASMRAEAIVSLENGGDAVVNDEALCDELFPWIESVTGPGKTKMYYRPTSYGGEDFAEVTERIPALVLKLGVGSLEEGYSLPIHHPSAVFDENSLVYGAAAYAACAYGWLEHHGKQNG